MPRDKCRPGPLARGEEGSPSIPVPSEFDGGVQFAQCTVGTSPNIASLGPVLARIPIRWGPYIDVEPGWYALVIDTDAQLAAIDPDYIVLQVKEKFGALRYYCQPSGDDPAPEVCDALDAITDEAERRSATICERCGQPGSLSDFAGSLKTLCQRCAEK